MTAPEFIYWRQEGDGNNWVLVDEPDSFIVGWLTERPGEVYDDGYGNRYRCDKAHKAVSAPERCMAAMGTAMAGPWYCGFPAKGTDENGRPVCGIHRKGQPGIEWYGENSRYPHGHGGRWRFSNGPQRDLS